jgi:hypothetical protein
MGIERFTFIASGPVSDSIVASHPHPPSIKVILASAPFTSKASDSSAKGAEATQRRISVTKTRRMTAVGTTG